MNRAKRNAAVATPYFATDSIHDLLSKKIPARLVSTAMDDAGWEINQIITYPGEKIRFKNTAHKIMKIVIPKKFVNNFDEQPDKETGRIIVNIEPGRRGKLTVKNKEVSKDVIVPFLATIGSAEVQPADDGMQVRVAYIEDDEEVEDEDEEDGASKATAGRPVIIIRGGTPPASFLRLVFTLVVGLVLGLLGAFFLGLRR